MKRAWTRNSARLTEEVIMDPWIKVYPIFAEDTMLNPLREMLHQGLPSVEFAKRTRTQIQVILTKEARAARVLGVCEAVYSFYRVLGTH